MELITSRQNRTIKLARALRERKAREREGLFLAEGIRLAVQAADSRAPVETVLICPELLRSSSGLQAVERLTQSGATAVHVSADAFAFLSPRDNPQGVAILVRSRVLSMASVDPGEGLCVVGLAQPQDPGNVGSIVRTCDAVGAGTLVLIGDLVDPFDPRSVRASMGAVFTIPIARASPQDIQEWLRHRGVSAVAVSGEAAANYQSFRYCRPLLLVLGSEREGVRLDLDFTGSVSIPMWGQVDSLNLSVAAGVILYEVLNQLTGETRPANRLARE